MTKRTVPPPDRAEHLARERTQAYGRTALKTADELIAGGAAPAEVAIGGFLAFMSMLRALSDRDQVRRILHQLGDGLLD